MLTLTIIIESVIHYMYCACISIQVTSVNGTKNGFLKTYPCRLYTCIRKCVLERVRVYVCNYACMYTCVHTHAQHVLGLAYPYLIQLTWSVG